MTEDGKDPKTLLADAIRKRDELNTFIKVLQEMMGLEAASESAATAKLPPASAGEASGEVAEPMAAVYPGMFFGKSQPEAARILLARVHRPLKTKVIVDCLKKGGMEVGGKKPAVNLWGILNRSKGFILVPKAGWGLTDWYDAKVLAQYQKAEKQDENGDDAADASEAKEGS